ncbi:MAG: hypothetical protein GY754_17345 [bacterium]|nr:hypothetical protein [bacterium]
MKNIFDIILKFALLPALCLLCMAVPSFSYYFNNYQHLVGDRAAGMAGAFTALADSGTALWYNPAGLARLESLSVNISANSYAYLETETKGFLQVPAGATGTQSIDVNEKEFSAVPNTVAFGLKLGEKTGLGFGIFIPYQNNIEGVMEAKWNTVSGDVVLKSSYLLERKLYQSMLGVGTELIKDLNIGISTGVGYFRSKYKNDVRFLYDLPASDIIATQEDDAYLDAILLQATAGVQYVITENNIIGIHYKSPLWNLHEEGEFTIIDWNSSNANDITYRAAISYDTFKQIRPMSLSAGYAFTMPGIFSLSIDGEAFYTSEWADNIVVNVKVGGEFFIAGSLVLRAGFYTDFSPDDDITVDTNKGIKPFADKLDYYSGTLSLSYGTNIGAEEKRQMSWTTIGGHFRYGVGEIQCIAYDSDFIPTKFVKDKTVWSISIFISETVSF